MINKNTSKLNGRLIYSIKIDTLYPKLIFKPINGFLLYSWGVSKCWTTVLPGPVLKILVDNADNLKNIKNDPVLMFRRLRNDFLKTRTHYYYEELNIFRKFTMSYDDIGSFSALDIFCFLHKKDRDNFLELIEIVVSISYGVNHGSYSKLVINRYFK